MHERPVSLLHLLRHAHAGDPLEWDGPDELRPLSKRGRRQAERLGAFLRECGVRPDLIVSSPKVRARQTAELVAEAFGMTVTMDERLGGYLDLATADAIVDSGEGGSVMLVGHDPDFSELLSELCGATGMVMKKGALATLEAEGPLRPGGATLRWLLPPELLSAG
jgi:phosphohistidine phosphatase